MISDVDLLVILASREKYERYFSFVKDNFLTKEGDVVGGYIAKYFDEDVLKIIPEISWSKFAAWFFLKHPMLSHDQRTNYKTFFTRLDEYEPEDENFEKTVLETLTVKAYASDISKAAMSIADGSSEDSITTISDLVTECSELLSDLDQGEDAHLAKVDFKKLFTPSTGHPVLTFSLKGLQEACKGIGMGHFVVVGAHPDSGKTTFLINQAAYMLPQLPEDKIITYFNNEQSMDDMTLRINCAVLGMTEDQIALDPVTAQADFIAKGGDRILLFDGATDAKFIEARLNKYKDKVGLILIDQLWKVKGIGNSKNDFMQIAHQFAWGRDIAKQYSPVITVTQADGASYGQRYIDMKGLFGSNIAIQGEADLIINIGRVTDGSFADNVRHLYVCKNKLRAADPTCRNNKFDTTINHELVKFEDIP